MANLKKFLLNWVEYERIVTNLPDNADLTGTDRKGTILITHLFKADALDPTLVAFATKPGFEIPDETSADDYQSELVPYKDATGNFPTVPIAEPFIVGSARDKIKRFERLVKDEDKAGDYEAFLFTPKRFDFGGDSFDRIEYVVQLIFPRDKPDEPPFEKLIGTKSFEANPSPPRQRL